MADITSKYVSVESLSTFLTTLVGKYGANTSSASDKYKVNWAQNAVAATKATNDASDNPIESTYVKQLNGIVEVKVLTTAGGTASPLTPTATTGGQSVTVDLSDYALKEEVAKVMDYKGSKTGSQLAAIKAGTITEALNGDVYTCSDAATSPYKQNYEYAAYVYDDNGTLKLDWIELGNWIDVSGYASKVSGATSGHLAGLDANGDLTDSGVEASLLDGNAVIDPSASGSEKFVTGAQVANAIQGLGTVVTGVQTQLDSASPVSIVSNGVATIPTTDSVTDGGTKLTTGEAVYEYATKVMNASSTHVNVLNEANSTDIAGIFSAYEA